MSWHRVCCCGGGSGPVPCSNPCAGCPTVYLVSLAGTLRLESIITAGKYRQWDIDELTIRYRRAGTEPPFGDPSSPSCVITASSGTADSALVRFAGTYSENELPATPDSVSVDFDLGPLTTNVFSGSYACPFGTSDESITLEVYGLTLSVPGLVWDPGQPQTDGQIGLLFPETTSTRERTVVCAASGTWPLVAGSYDVLLETVVTFPTVLSVVADPSFP